MNETERRHRRRRLPRLTRDTVIFLAGLAGMAHETLFAHAERPFLIAVFAAMLGLPAFLRFDERAAHDNTDSADGRQTNGSTS